MKKTLSLAFLFLIEISAFAAKKQQIPEWVLNLESVFPAEHFITKEGIGKTQDEARLNALSEISFFFDTKVFVNILKKIQTKKRRPKNLKNRGKTKRKKNGTVSATLNGKTSGISMIQN